MPDLNLTIPFDYTPRWYQLPILKALDLGIKRIAWVAHRRSGKDKTAFNAVIKEMVRRVGAYYYIFPTYTQGRKILWDGIGKDGKKLLHHFPKELIASINNTEMKVTLTNGSIFQIVGADNIDSIVGTNPVGVVFSEYSIMDPLAWRYIRPILAENGGWAIFVYTPRGENHGYDLWTLAVQEFKQAKADNKMPLWYAQMNKASETKVIPQDVLDQERKEIIHQDGNDALYMQEMECSFSTPLAGAFYAAQIQRALQEGRIGRVPHNPRYKVDTWWDLGVNDRMAIWFTQTMGATLHFIDYYEFSGQGLDHYIGKLQEKGYVYGRHVAPHDIRQRELTNGKQRIDTARSLGINFDIAPSLSFQDGIDSGRALFNKCYFDSEKCADGLNALKNYTKVFDAKRKIYLKEPLHNWASNGADAYRYCAISIDDAIDGYKPARRDAYSMDDENVDAWEKASADAV